MSATEVISKEETTVVRLAEELLKKFPPAKTPVVEFLGAQFDMGLAWVNFPVGHGGLGISPKFQKAVNEILYPAGAPNPMYRNPIGHGMCGPTVVEWGSEEQKNRYLRPLFTGEEIWCQLFSEPGSGSDFAGLSSKGVKDGEEWIANGQKVWTTLAHLSRFGLLVVRTDPEAVKHAGLTAFVVDMQAPGVEVRPLRQMTGEAEFNEVYFTDVRIAEKTKASRDPKGRGWSTLGDVGYLDPDNFLYLTDRKAFMIISGGVNIYPQESENILVNHPKVMDIAVFGVPNDDFGEEVKAVVQPVTMPATPEEADALAKELIAFCKTHLADIKCPRSIDFMPDLPRHPTGKLYKRLLKDEYWKAAGRSI